MSHRTAGEAFRGELADGVTESFSISSALLELIAGFILAGLPVRLVVPARHLVEENPALNSDTRLLDDCLARSVRAVLGRLGR